MSRLSQDDITDLNDDQQLSIREGNNTESRSMSTSISRPSQDDITHLKDDQQSTVAIAAGSQLPPETAVRREGQVVAETTQENNKDHAEEPTIGKKDHEQQEAIQTNNNKPQQAVEEVCYDEEDIEWHAPFGESTFTFLFMCKPCSHAFVYALFVYLLQLSFVILALVDAIDAGSPNPLQLPPMVGLPTTLAQVVILFVVVAFQSDLMEAVSKLHDGYYPPIISVFPGATYATWLMSCIAQLIIGLLILVVTFILTMQVDNVVNSMLNFAALHFIADIDDIGFELAKLGFVSHKVQRSVWRVADFKVPKQDKGNALRRGLYLGTLVGIFVGFAILKGRQFHGYYLPTYLFVQFDDAYIAKLSHYSGAFEAEVARTAGHRSYHDIATQSISLAYCDKENAWTFSETSDPCDFFARSVKVNTYDVTSIPWSDWLEKDSFSRLQPFESFRLLNNDCDEKTCRGKCENGRCTCPPDSFGFDCEFTTVCPALIVNGKHGPFPEASLDGTGITRTYTIGDRYHLLRDERGELVRVYSMPVYYSIRNLCQWWSVH
ncbi:expressed unknown protein [Seminavis robusta]|uniref:Uncharacterized protein n=1 Tax=Seminavis robusta TaxID=568900 RepID=A0A9N8DJZ9_9STRA|nr:expressed unknown protein [Seminavis robusta]|eukprot:Sro123_g059440.1 n/a (548) ;mRNA; f:17466-19288